mgnify:CR=1 FL=1
MTAQEKSLPIRLIQGGTVGDQSDIPCMIITCEKSDCTPIIFVGREKTWLDRVHFISPEDGTSRVVYTVKDKKGFIGIGAGEEIEVKEVFIRRDWQVNGI